MIIPSIDMGGTKTMAGLVDGTGHIVYQERFATDTTDFYKNLYRACDILKAAIATRRLTTEVMAGLGISLPGMVDTAGTQLVRAVYPGWSNIPVPALVRDYMHVENVKIENDVNACAIGEMVFGFKDTYRDFLWLTVSTGVGGALVSQGQLIHGHGGCAGEMGHVKVEYTQPAPCPCGQSGCLEAHGSGKALDRYIKETLQTQPDFALDFKKNRLDINGAGCAALARLGNPYALDIFKKMGTYLGRGIAYAVNLLNPQAIIVGGGVSASLDLLKPAMAHTLGQSANTALLPVDVVRTKLGYDAAFLGAAALILH